MTTLETPTINANANASKDATKEVSFGNGRYSALMAESFKMAQAIFKLDEKHAERIARQIGSDFGAAAQNGIVKASLGKINGDGKVTVSEACKVKGVTVTPALSIMYALQWIGKAGDYGISYGFTTWKADKTLQVCIDKFAVSE